MTIFKLLFRVAIGFAAWLWAVQQPWLPILRNMPDLSQLHWKKGLAIARDAVRHFWAIANPLQPVPDARVVELPPIRVIVEAGEAMTVGSLSDAEIQPHLLYCSAGETLAVAVEPEDAFLVLSSPSKTEIWLQQGQVTVPLAETGDYRVDVRSVAGKAGKYVLLFQVE